MVKKNNFIKETRPKTTKNTTTMVNPGRGRGRGRFGSRGRGSRGFSKPKQENKSTDMATAKFVVGTAKQASEFTKLKKYLINQVKMKYKQGIYIATAMEEGVEYDFKDEKPSPLVLLLEDPDEEDYMEKMGINESRKIDYKMQMEEYTDKQRSYIENKYKVYSLLWEKCATQMKHTIEAKAEYSMKIKNNPLELSRVQV